MHIKEFASLTGVSVRTLHYYDEIGLLKPSFVDEQNGYRFYGDDSVRRMQEILFYKELDFPLKSIAEILSSPNYDRQKALCSQKQLLILKKERLERLIRTLDSAMKGENVNMKAFDNSEYEAARKKYADEAYERWGKTTAYKEFSEKTAEYSDEHRSKLITEMNGIIAEFAECMKGGAKPSDEPAQALVGKWQDFITHNLYTCTKEILSGLGKMYVSDERFRNNIDAFGTGTAEFISAAVQKYCG